MSSKKPVTDRALLSSIHDGLMHHPDLAERFNSILKIANEPTDGGNIRSADEVESLVTEELRKLGNESLVGWAEGVDHRLAEELKQADPTVKMREKKL